MRSSSAIICCTSPGQSRMVAYARPENNTAAVSSRSGERSLRFTHVLFDSIVMRVRESTHHWLPAKGRSGIRARRPAAPGQRSAGTGRNVSHAEGLTHGMSRGAGGPRSEPGMEHRPRPRLPPSRVLIAEGERAPTRRSFLVEVRTVGHSGILENHGDHVVAEARAQHKMSLDLDARIVLRIS
jgi:hypothetical protein